MPLHALGLPAGIRPVVVTSAISYAITGDRLHTSFHGVVTVEDVLTYLDMLSADPDYRAYFTALIDVRAMKTVPSIAGLRTIVGELTIHADASRWTGRRAVVAGRCNGYRALCMFEVLAEHLPVRYRVFADPFEAKQWLDVAQPITRVQLAGDTVVGRRSVVPRHIG